MKIIIETDKISDVTGCCADMWGHIFLGHLKVATHMWGLYPNGEVYSEENRMRFCPYCGVAVHIANKD